jgi:hypothetical protein
MDASMVCLPQLACDRVPFLHRKRFARFSREGKEIIIIAIV